MRIIIINFLTIDPSTFSKLQWLFFSCERNKVHYNIKHDSSALNLHYNGSSALNFVKNIDLPPLLAPILNMIHQKKKKKTSTIN